MSKLIPVFRQHRQRRYFDAFLDQGARFVRRSLAVDRAMLDIAVMHLAGLVGKTLADIVGVLHDMIAQFLELGAQLALLRHQQRRGGGRGGRCLGCGGRGGGRLRRRNLAALPAHDLRGHDRALDLGRTAGRTVHQLALFLLFVGRGRLKPAFEFMAGLAAERIADHADPRTRCRCSGPAFGSATLKRLPCCSDGTALRAVSTLAGSIFARKTPGSTPPSASTVPQGSTIREWPKVSRLFSCMPPCAAANTKQPVSMARARNSVCQCASPVFRVKAEGTVRNDAPLSASARYSAGKRTS